MKKVLKVVPILTVLLLEFSSLIHRVSLFLLDDFLVGRKFHVIKVNHETKYTEKVAVDVYNNQFLEHISKAGLDGKGVGSHSHAPGHAMLKRHVWYVARLKRPSSIKKNMTCLIVHLLLR